MIIIDSYKCFSIKELLEIYTEDELFSIFSGFCCTKNYEIQEFLRNSAIEFNKKHQSITYVIFNNKKEIEGYFSLSIKAINIQGDILSKTELKKVLRIADLEMENNNINPAAYLIAQVGKTNNSNLNIDLLFRFIDYNIGVAQETCGGVVEFLEAENSEKLIDIYKERGFKTFNIRKSKRGEDRKLVQMYRLI